MLMFDFAGYGGILAYGCCLSGAPLVVAAVLLMDVEANSFGHQTHIAPEG